MRTYVSPFDCSTLLFCFLFTVPVWGYGQETTLPAGGDAIGLDGSASFSLGQLFYNTNESASGSALHGVQQCYEISVVTNTQEAENIRIECSIFPNPVTDVIKLNIQNPKYSKLSYTLYNSFGQVIISNSAEESETSISMSELTPSIYFLELKTENKSIKTFKIIKN